MELFHLDEYIGLPINHPASFCRFLQEHLISKTGITNYHFLNGEETPAEVIDRTNKAISEAPIDIAFVGIGENGHLAFNDPPADFETEAPYIVVKLDEPCRGSKWGKAGSKTSRRCRAKPSQCLCDRSSIEGDYRRRAGRAQSRRHQSMFRRGISPMAPSSILRNSSAGHDLSGQAISFQANP